MSSTAAPLSRTKITFPQWLGTRNTKNFPLKTQTSASTRKYQPAHVLTLCGNTSPPQNQPLNSHTCVVVLPTFAEAKSPSKPENRTRSLSTTCVELVLSEQMKYLVA